MGLYDVLSPCIVGGKHYIRPAVGVEVDDNEAADLVEAGLLAPVVRIAVTIGDGKAEEAALTADIADAQEPETNDEPEAPRRGRTR